MAREVILGLQALESEDPVSLDDLCGHTCSVSCCTIST